MNQYNPFKGEENPFDERDSFKPNNENTRTPGSTFDYRRTATYFFALFFISILSSLIYSLGDYSNSETDADYQEISVEKVTAPPTSATSVITDTDDQKKEDNTFTEKVNENLSVSNTDEEVIKQNTITVKTVQVIAEECGSGLEDIKKDTSVGSGVLISTDGLIISNHHIIENCYGDIFIATTNDVDTPTDIRYFAKIVQESVELDLVLLKITSSIDNTPIDNTFEYFELSSTEELFLGDEVEIWGFPTARGDGTSYSLKINLTKGTVSGFESDYGVKRGWIVSDADITYGNSGGAALDNSGRLVGIPTFGTTEGASWINYLRSVDVINVWMNEGNKPLLLTPELEIKEHDLNSIPQYDRNEWKAWIDSDGDCQNTRHENLQLESLIEVTFTSKDECYVDSGKWFDPYNGVYFYSSKEVDIDHFLPLFNVHLSGGWAWSSTKKIEFANSLKDPDLLITVESSANREKSANAPDKWKPYNESYWCEYAYDWTRIKSEWELTVTQSEWDALQDMIRTCPPDFLYEDAINKSHTFGEEKLRLYLLKN